MIDMSHLFKSCFSPGTLIACLAVLFLVSETAGFITGQALDVDGGELLAWMDFETYRNRRKRFVQKDRKTP